MQLPSCASPVLLLLLVPLLPLCLGQCKVAEDQGGAEYTRGILVGSVQCVTLGQKENQTFVLADYLIFMKKN